MQGGGNDHGTEPDSLTEEAETKRAQTCRLTGHGKDRNTEGRNEGPEDDPAGHTPIRPHPGVPCFCPVCQNLGPCALGT